MNIDTMFKFNQAFSSEQERLEIQNAYLNIDGSPSLKEFLTKWMMTCEGTFIICVWKSENFPCCALAHFTMVNKYVCDTIVLPKQLASG